MNRAGGLDHWRDAICKFELLHSRQHDKKRHTPLPALHVAAAEGRQEVPVWQTLLFQSLTTCPYNCQTRKHQQQHFFVDLVPTRRPPKIGGSLTISSSRKASGMLVAEIFSPPTTLLSLKNLNDRLQKIEARSLQRLLLENASKKPFTTYQFTYADQLIWLNVSAAATVCAPGQHPWS